MAILGTKILLLQMFASQEGDGSVRSCFFRGLPEVHAVTCLNGALRPVGGLVLFVVTAQPVLMTDFSLTQDQCEGQG